MRSSSCPAAFSVRTSWRIQRPAAADTRSTGSASLRAPSVTADPKHELDCRPPHRPAQHRVRPASCHDICVDTGECGCGCHMETDREFQLTWCQPGCRSTRSAARSDRAADCQSVRVRRRPEASAGRGTSQNSVNLLGCFALYELPGPHNMQTDRGGQDDTSVLGSEENMTHRKCGNVLTCASGHFLVLIPVISTLSVSHLSLLSLF